MSAAIRTLRETLERFLGVNFGYVLRGGGWLTLDQVAANFIGILLAVAFANLISPETYGTYRYLLSIFGILTVFSLPSMNLALTTSVAKGYEGSFWSALRARIRWGTLGSVISLIIGIYYFFQDEQLLGLGLTLMALFLPLNDPLNIFIGFLRGRQLFKLQTVYSVITRFLSALALFLALLLTGNLLLILTALFLPYVLIRSVLLWRVVRRFPFNQKNDPAGTVSYGWHLSGIQLINVLVNSLDNLLIFNFLGPVALAVYNIALLPVNKIQQLFSVLTELALPKFSAMSAQDLRKTLLDKIIKSLIFVLVGVGIYLLLAPLIFPLIFPKYPTAIPYNLVIALSLLSLPLAFIYTFFQSQAAAKKIAQYNFLIRIFQTSFVFILVPLYGIWGAVFARLAFHAASVVILLVLFGGRSGQKLESRILIGKGWAEKNG